MIPASYLFKTIYRDAWGVDLTEEHAKPGDDVARPGDLRRVAGVVLRAIAAAGRLILPAPTAREVRSVQHPENEQGAHEGSPTLCRSESPVSGVLP